MQSNGTRRCRSIVGWVSAKRVTQRRFWRCWVTAFGLTQPTPLPPGESKSKDARYLDVHEDDQLDEAQLAAWVKQASLLPGKRM
jgi:hypothetical protein